MENDTKENNKRPAFLKKSIVEIAIYLTIALLSVLAICLICKICEDQIIISIFLSLSCSLLGATIIGIAFAIRTLIEQYEDRKDRLNRIIKKTTFFFLFTIAPVYTKSIGGLTAKEYVEKEMASKKFQLISNAQAYRRHLYDDLEKSDESLFYLNEWKLLRSARVYIEIIPDWSDEMSGENLIDIFAILLSIDEINKQFEKNVDDLFTEYGISPDEYKITSSQSSAQVNNVQTSFRRGVLNYGNIANIVKTISGVDLKTIRSKLAIAKAHEDPPEMRDNIVLPNGTKIKR